MANRKSGGDTLLTKIARTVGSTLGTVASRAANLAGSISDDAPSAVKRKRKKARSGAELRRTAQPKKQLKRTREKRKDTQKDAKAKKAPKG
jgi:hypothetical protein